MLYHYTSFAGLLAIAERKTIWATDIWFLNDSAEFSLALDLAKLALQDRMEASDTKFARGLCKVMLESLSSVSETQTFVASFTEHGDQLSQWRGYCPASGYALGFATRALMNGGRSREDVLLLPCIYDPDEQLDLIDQLIELSIAFAESNRSVDPDNSDRLLRETYKLFGTLVGLVAPILKHHTFEEESEWRLISPPGSADPTRIRIRPGRSTLVPYIELSLPKTTGALRIERLVIGATPHPALARQATELLLRGCGIFGATVEQSGIPFRNW
jgi:hypothetical protein